MTPAEAWAAELKAAVEKMCEQIDRATETIREMQQMNARLSAENQRLRDELLSTIAVRPKAVA